MRQTRTRAESSHEPDVDGGDRDQLQAWITSETKELGADELRELRPRTASAQRQDRDWENDATTHFRRDPSDAKWAGELGNTFERDDSPSEPPLSLQSLPVPSSHPSLSAGDLGVEGGLQRSLPPRRSTWLRSLWFIVPMLTVLAAGISWSVPSSSLRTLATHLPEPLARYFAPRSPAAPPQPIAAHQPESEAIVPEPVAKIPTSAEPSETRAAPQPVPAQPTATGAVAPGVELPRVDAPLERRMTRAETRRRNRELRRARADALARPITPLRDTEPPPAAPAANMGILQINSRPWARVLVDGRFVGHTPQRALQLAPGRHQIRLINEPLEMSKSFDVRIVAGQTVTRVELLEDDPSVQQ